MVFERKWKSALQIGCGPDVGLCFETCLDLIFQICVCVMDFLKRISLQKPIFLTLINNTLKAQSIWDPTTLGNTLITQIKLGTYYVLLREIGSAGALSRTPKEDKNVRDHNFEIMTLIGP